MYLLFNYPFGCGWSEYDKSLSAHLSTNSTCSSSSKRSPVWNSETAGSTALDLKPRKLDPFLGLLVVIPAEKEAVLLEAYSVTLLAISDSWFWTLITCWDSWTHDNDSGS